MNKIKNAYNFVMEIYLEYVGLRAKYKSQIGSGE